MKVVMLTTSFPAYKGHIQSPFVYRLSVSLAKRTCLLVICPFYKASRKKKELLDGIKVNRFRYFWPLSLQKLTEKGGLPSQFKEYLLAKIQLPLFMLSMLYNTIRASRSCDLIHCQWALAGFVGVLVKKIRAKPLVVTLRGADVETARKNKAFNMLVRFVLKNADSITSNNRYLIEQATHIQPNLKTSIIYNGVDTQLFRQRDKNKVRKKLGLPQNKKIILYVGWLIERKGVNYLIEALPSVMNRHKDCMMLILGEGNRKENLQELTKQLGLDKKVLFLGPKLQEEVAFYMSAADMLVLPSLSEGLPNVVLEAMASAVPVIATEVCGTPEVITHNKTGLLVKPKSKEDLAKQMNFLLGSNKTASIVKEAKNTVDRFTWDQSAEHYLSIYQKLTNTKKR